MYLCIDKPKQPKVMYEIKIFENPDFGQVRTTTGENGAPFFCAVDVCNILPASGASAEEWRMNSTVLPITQYCPSAGKWGKADEDVELRKEFGKGASFNVNETQSLDDVTME